MPNLTVKQGNSVTDILFEGMPELSFVLKQNGFLSETPCGGKGVCGKCRVHVEGSLSGLTAKEKERLTSAEIEQGMRLCCQVRLTGDALVTIPKAAELVNIQLEGGIPAFSSNPMEGRIGVAVDIGTTTLVLRMVDLEHANVLEAVSSANPQGCIAADVIGRIEAALNGESGRLHGLLMEEIEKLLGELCQKCVVSPEDIDILIIAGNTTMLYLLTRRNPAALSHAPFSADCLFGLWTDGAALGLQKTAHAKVYLPACIGAFVGADISCGLLASQMCTRPETALLVDLGTNGEIALWHGGALYVTATAAGPAFEGGNIHMGVGSVLGAIDRVWAEDKKICYTTIGNCEPVGICGSGLIDAVATLIKLGLVDETGLMEMGEAFISEKISLSQKDIRNVQLAKGAIAAGIKTICQHVGITVSQIDTLYIAGGFGSHADIQNAAAIGLIPNELKGKAVVLGNASLTGAVMLLLQRGFESDTMVLASRAVSVPLGGSGIFAEYYMECMLFDEDTYEKGCGIRL
jgi:uncharacterized 2Fe-2S/4Fe-4S cluster protein (DUF4445 family)